MMTETEMTDLIRFALEASVESEVEEVVRSVSTFAEQGVMSMNAGLVICTEDGAEFQVTVVRSR